MKNENSKKPNIVLITIDSLRSDFVGHINKEEKNSPFIDSLAKKSISFTNAIVPSAPTFFAFPPIMMGQPPFTFGKYLGVPRKKEAVTLAEVLQQHGYQTTAFLADNPALYKSFGFDRGFDNYFDSFEEETEKERRNSNKIKKLKKRLPKQLFTVLQSLNRTYKTPSILIDGKNLNKKVTKFYSKSITSPHFLWVHYMDVHFPYFSGIDEYFRSDRSLLRKSRDKYYFYKHLQKCIETMRIDDKKILDILIDIYRSSIRYTDDRVKELYTHIREKDPNTIFVITSDHGEEFMEHDFAFHEPFNLYNELIKVPLMFNFPDDRAEKKDDTVSLLSLAKTISSIAGIKKTPFSGSDVLNEPPSQEDKICKILNKCRAPHIRMNIFNNNTEIEGFEALCALFSDNYKLIANKKKSIVELYDIKKDPHEMKNLETKPSSMADVTDNLFANMNSVC